VSRRVLRAPQALPRCSICRAEIAEGGLTFTDTNARAPRIEIGLYCRERCRDAARAAMEIRNARLGVSPEARRQRDEIADALLDLWRHGLGPDPADVLFAAEYANA
jgi:hypothetical protein